MKLEIRTKRDNFIQVTTNWTNYSVFFSQSVAQVITFGLVEEFSTEHFPDSAKNEAIAAYLITQLELRSLD